MAVSPQQQLRPVSLLDSIRAYLTPDLIRGASSAVREPESATRLALNTSVPSILAGLTQLSSSSEGVSKLGNLVRDGAYAPVVDNASTLFAGGSPTTNMMSAGQQLLGNIFGENSSSVIDMLARNSGIRSSSAASLMGMTAPLVLGVIGKYASSQGLNASGIAGLLRGQKESIFGALPAGMSQLIGLSGPRVVPAVIEQLPRYLYHCGKGRSENVFGRSHRAVHSQFKEMVVDRAHRVRSSIAVDVRAQSRPRRIAHQAVATERNIHFGSRRLAQLQPGQLPGFSAGCSEDIRLRSFELPDGFDRADTGFCAKCG